MPCNIEPEGVTGSRAAEIVWYPVGGGVRITGGLGEVDAPERQGRKLDDERLVSFEAINPLELALYQRHDPQHSDEGGALAVDDECLAVAKSPVGLVAVGIGSGYPRQGLALRVVWGIEVRNERAIQDAKPFELDEVVKIQCFL